MIENYVVLRDRLIAQQDEAHKNFHKAKSKKTISKCGMVVHNLGEQINTISHVVLELAKRGIENPVINQQGRCYGCGKVIDLENEQCNIYKSSRNQSISLFHPRCEIPVAGGPSLITTIGRIPNSRTSDKTGDST